MFIIIIWIVPTAINHWMTSIHSLIIITCPRNVSERQWWQLNRAFRLAPLSFLISADSQLSDCSNCLHITLNGQTDVEMILAHLLNWFVEQTVDKPNIVFIFNNIVSDLRVQVEHWWCNSFYFLSNLLWFEKEKEQCRVLTWTHTVRRMLERWAFRLFLTGDVHSSLVFLVGKIQIEISISSGHCFAAFFVLLKHKKNEDATWFCSDVSFRKRYFDWILIWNKKESLLWKWRNEKQITWYRLQHLERHYWHFHYHRTHLSSIMSNCHVTIA